MACGHDRWVLQVVMVGGCGCVVMIGGCGYVISSPF